MCDKYINEFSPIAELSKLEIKQNEILVVKIDIEKFDISEAQSIFKSIHKELPEGTLTIGIPVGVDLEVSTIDDMIYQLREMKNGILH